MNEREAKKLFAAELRSFRSFFPLAGVKFIIHKRENTPGCNKFRDMAWADPNENTINICRRVLDLSYNTFLGLVRHEIGHLCDPFLGTSLCEQRADDIAELVTGNRISYSGPHRIQTIGDGEYPRPKTLHA